MIQQHSVSGLLGLAQLLLLFEICPGAFKCDQKWVWMSGALGPSIG